jgi:hypothetical protein
MEIAVISLGHVTNWGQLLGRSRLPLIIASIMDGWSEPTFTKHVLMPAYRIVRM